MEPAGPRLGSTQGLLCSSFWGLLWFLGRGLQYTTQKGTRVWVGAMNMRTVAKEKLQEFGQSLGAKDIRLGWLSCDPQLV